MLIKKCRLVSHIDEEFHSNIVETCLCTCRIFMKFMMRRNFVCAKFFFVGSVIVDFYHIISCNLRGNVKMLREAHQFAGVGNNNICHKVYEVFDY